MLKDFTVSFRFCKQFQNSSFCLERRKDDSRIDVIFDNNTFASNDEYFCCSLTMKTFLFPSFLTPDQQLIVNQNIIILRFGLLRFFQGVITTISSLRGTGNSTVTITANQQNTQASSSVSIMVAAIPLISRSAPKFAIDSLVYNIYENIPIGMNFSLNFSLLFSYLAFEHLIFAFIAYKFGHFFIIYHLVPTT